MKDLKAIRDQATRQAIIDAGRSIIVEKGLPGFSMRDLAKSVGCSPATLYKHFENKEDILAAIREEGWQIMAQLAAESEPNAATPKEALLALSQTYQRFPTEFPEHYLLMFGSLMAEPFTVESHRQDEGFRRLVEMIEDAMQNGIIKATTYTAKQLSYHIWFVSHGIAMLRITLFRNDPKFKIISDDVLAAFAESVLASEGDLSE